MYCPACGQKTDDDAAFCRSCGKVLVELDSAERKPSGRAPSDVGSPPIRAGLSPNEILYQAHPTVFRANPLATILLCLIVVGIPVVIWRFLGALGTTLTITRDKVIYRTGIIAKRTNEAFLSDIVGVQVRQEALERIMGVGTVILGTASTAGEEFQIPGLPNPERIKQIIDRHRQDQREAHGRR